MQQYERFGVLALLLLVVTLVVVALLGEDPRSPEALAEATAAAEAQSRSARLQTTTPRGERVPRSRRPAPPQRDPKDDRRPRPRSAVSSGC